MWKTKKTLSQSASRPGLFPQTQVNYRPHFFKVIFARNTNEGSVDPRTLTTRAGSPRGRGTRRGVRRDRDETGRSWKRYRRLSRAVRTLSETDRWRDLHGGMWKERERESKPPTFPCDRWRSCDDREGSTRRTYGGATRRTRIADRTGGDSFKRVISLQPVASVRI